MYIKKSSITGTPNASLNKAGVLKPDNNDTYIKNGILTLNNPQLTTQSSGSDDDIESLLKYYYDKIINLEDIQSVQAVGDIRQANETNCSMMKIAAHNSFSGDNINSIPEQSTVKQIIIGFDKEDLVEPINNITKALITIQMLGILGSSASEGIFGKIHSSVVSTTNIEGQKGSQRRIQCNSNFYNALGFKSQIKQVIKQTGMYGDSTNLYYTNDYCQLLSVRETGTSKTDNCNQSVAIDEGYSYNYYFYQSEKQKYEGQEGTGSTCGQQLRSPSNSNSYSFNIKSATPIGYQAGYSSNSIDNNYGISIACCL